MTFFPKTFSFDLKEIARYQVCNYKFHSYMQEACDLMSINVLVMHILILLR